ncbi:hypothetical protein PVK06_021748 [Gossypium arboreum]|uniref:Reverse transcriptase n=1 Tax=Gossypium arboreum TaxID=29729 RepID=A0ABR0PQW2_GOSAR|nr:hypothetical protein PVK06_021748 [Gossypium arboreum]
METKIDRSRMEKVRISYGFFNEIEVGSIGSRARELPWLVSGDFNEIMYGREKKGGLPLEEGRMEAFRRVLED